MSKYNLKFFKCQFDSCDFVSVNKRGMSNHIKYQHPRSNDILTYQELIKESMKPVIIESDNAKTEKVISPNSQNTNSFQVNKRKGNTKQASTIKENPHQTRNKPKKQSVRTLPTRNKSNISLYNSGNPSTSKTSSNKKYKHEEILDLTINSDEKSSEFTVSLDKITANEDESVVSEFEVIGSGKEEELYTSENEELDYETHLSSQEYHSFDSNLGKRSKLPNDNALRGINKRKKYISPTLSKHDKRLLEASNNEKSEICNENISDKSPTNKLDVSNKAVINKKRILKNRPIDRKSISKDDNSLKHGANAKSSYFPIKFKQGRRRKPMAKKSFLHYLKDVTVSIEKLPESFLDKEQAKKKLTGNTIKSPVLGIENCNGSYKKSSPENYKGLAINKRPSSNDEMSKSKKYAQDKNSVIFSPKIGGVNELVSKLRVEKSSKNNLQNKALDISNDSTKKIAIQLNNKSNDSTVMKSSVVEGIILTKSKTRDGKTLAIIPKSVIDKIKANNQNVLSSSIKVVDPIVPTRFSPIKIQSSPPPSESPIITQQNADIINVSPKKPETPNDHSEMCDISKDNQIKTPRTYYNKRKFINKSNDSAVKSQKPIKRVDIPKKCNSKTKMPTTNRRSDSQPIPKIILNQIRTGPSKYRFILPAPAPENQDTSCKTIKKFTSVTEPQPSGPSISNHNSLDTFSPVITSAQTINELMESLDSEAIEPLNPEPIENFESNEMKDFSLKENSIKNSTSMQKLSKTALIRLKPIEKLTSLKKTIDECQFPTRNIKVHQTSIKSTEEIRSYTKTINPSTNHNLKPQSPIKPNTIMQPQPTRKPMEIVEPRIQNLNKDGYFDKTPVSLLSEDELFFKTMLPQFNKLSQTSKAEIKFKIHQLIHEAVMKEIK